MYKAFFFVIFIDSCKTGNNNYATNFYASGTKDSEGRMKGDSWIKRPGIGKRPLVLFQKRDLNRILYF